MIECLKMHKENFDYCLGELIRESEEKDKEIEGLQNKNEELMTLYTTEREVKEDYKSIIKEVREYIENIETDYSIGCWNKENEFIDVKKDILEILDKECNSDK